MPPRRRVFAKLMILPQSMHPDDITKRLGVKPTTSWAKGDWYDGRYFDTQERVVRSKKRRRSNNHWRLSSEHVIESHDINHHVDHILNLLHPKQEQLAGLLENPNEYFVRFSIWMDWPTGDGSFSISQKSLRMISDISHELYIVSIHRDDLDEEDADDDGE